MKYGARRPAAVCALLVLLSVVGADGRSKEGLSGALLNSRRDRRYPCGLPRASGGTIGAGNRG
jgi:hypothetical protein